MPIIHYDDPNIKRDDLAVLVRQGFEGELCPEFNRYVYEYCRKHHILHSEACKHIIVQDVYVQMMKNMENKEVKACVPVDKDYSDDRSC